MKKLFTITLTYFVFSSASISQTASFKLSINNINATVLNGGDLFNSLVDPHGIFEAPKGSGKTPIYTCALWIGGLDGQKNLHLSACTYRQDGEAFEPGPVSDSSYSMKKVIYDKIFYITRAEIDYHKLHFTNANYVPSAAIATWPGNGKTDKGEAQRLAPFMDLNNDGKYEPLIGDYPLIPGDACTFTLFNDKTHPDAMGIEVHQFVYAFNDPQTVLNNTIFVSYKIFNRSSNDYTETYMGQFMDYDIGNYNDDAYCSDSIRNLMYAYNADDNDEGVFGYGSNPPAMGCVFLNNPMNKVISYFNDFSLFGNPVTLQHYYGYMKGLYKNNTIIPRHSCADSITGVDTRVLGSTGPFTLLSQKSHCFTVAHIFAKTTFGGAKGSVDLLKQSTDYVLKYSYNHWIDDACMAYDIADGIKSNTSSEKEFSVYPNPVIGMLTIKSSSLKRMEGHCTIINMLGEEISGFNLSVDETNIDVSSFAPGMYLIRSENYTLKFVKE